MSSDSDKRTSPRRALMLRVDYADKGAYFSAWTENVSEGGLFVVTDESYALGDGLKLRLSFPGLLQPVEIQGVVAWLREGNDDGPAGVGLRVERDVCRRRLADLAILASRSGVGGQSRAYRVLIVEDNPIIARVFERVLRRFNELEGTEVEVVCATNGHEALTIMEEGPIDLVITDMYMPIMDGVSLIKSVRERNEALPILLVTSGTDEDIAMAQAAGATMLVRKPFQYGRILETIVCLLKSPHDEDVTPAQSSP